MTELDDQRGILFPTRLPTFRRVPAPAALADAIRWFWIPRWKLAPGRTSRQRVLPFPTCNLVVETDGVTLVGPATRPTHRDLTGTGWAVGALLRPAALPALGHEPERIRDAAVVFDAPELFDPVFAAMDAPRATRPTADDPRGTRADPGDQPGSTTTDADAADGRTDRAVAAFCDWARARLPEPDAGGRLANAIEDLIAGDRAIVRVDQVAGALNISTRGVQRITRRYFGLPPLAIIRRYRLQEAAQRLRTDPSATIARVAADLGYSDHAHLTTDFRQILGLQPSAYRRTLTDPPSAD